MENQETLEVRQCPLLTPVRALFVSAGLVIAGSAASAVLSGIAAAKPFMATGWPFVNLAVSIVLVVLLISAGKLHAFLALLLAAMAAGFMSGVGKLPGEPAVSHWVAAVELTASEFGVLASKVGIVIALASVIGMCLLESGAADKVVRRFLALFGPKRAGLALLLSTFIVSIPIFFETIFMLLAPLAQALARRTGKDYVLYLMAICCAAAITHNNVIPHPGPTALAGALHIDAGIAMLAGLATGVIPLALGWAAMAWINRRMPIQPPLDSESDDVGVSAADEPEASLPPLLWSLSPILLPVLLIGAASAAKALGGSCPAVLREGALFAGNRHVALLIGVTVAVGVLMRHRRLSLNQVTLRMGRPLETAGIIILIICAGGSFGALLKAAGIGDAIASVASVYRINLVLLSFLVAAVFRIAQGSATVSMITTASIVYPMMAEGLPYHPIYIFMAIGYGSLFVSWMNDGGFWVISRLGGLTERETLASWTVLTGVLSVTGLIMTLILSQLIPLAVK